VQNSKGLLDGLFIDAIPKVDNTDPSKSHLAGE
jgi:hypothetical protein